MPQEIRTSQQRSIAFSRLFVAVVAAGLGCAPWAMLHAQSPAVRGYITAVRPPDGFDVNGEHVNTTAETRFGVMGTKNPVSNGPMRDAMQIGAWVQVFGEPDRKAKTVAARTVRFRDDWNRKLTGLGEIDKVISAAPDLVFAADGYRIRVTPTTDIKFPLNMKPVPNVHANLWVLYEGKLGQDGVLVASKVRILPTDHPKVKSENAPGDSSEPAATPKPPGNGNLVAKDNAPPPNSASSQTEDQVDDRRRDIQLNDDTYQISKDQALRSRVRRIGKSLIPRSQKQLPEDDLSKIPFDFIAVDDPARGVHTSLDADGVVLVSAQLAEDSRMTISLPPCWPMALHSGCNKKRPKCSR